jgi:hypothetical protein
MKRSLKITEGSYKNFSDLQIIVIPITLYINMTLNYLKRVAVG